MTSPRDGGCQCGNIRYRLHGAPQMLYVCHCTDCQKQSASAFGMSLIVTPQQVEFLRGEAALSSWDTRGGNGDIKRCHFCLDCGMCIMYGLNDFEDSVSIKAGLFDDKSDL